MFSLARWGSKNAERSQLPTLPLLYTLDDTLMGAPFLFLFGVVQPSLCFQPYLVKVYATEYFNAMTH